MTFTFLKPKQYNAIYSESTKILIEREIPSKELMRAESEIKSLESKLAESERKLGVAVKALEFYSELTNNPIQYMRQGTLVYNLKKIAFIDGGQNAKDALKEINN